MNTRSRSVVALVLLACGALLAWFFVDEQASNEPIEQNATKMEPASSSLQPASSQIAPVRRDDPAPTTPSGTLRGKVVDAVTRKPVRDFKVEFFQARGTSWRRDTPTGRDFRTKDGTFVWRPAPTGIWMIAVSASGYQRFEIGHVLIDADTATTEFVMPMRKGFSIRGRVFDKASGEAIREARISYREAGTGDFEDNFRARPYAVTRKDGSFSVDGAPGGFVTLRASADGYSPLSVNVTVDGMTPAVEIALSTGASISGRLVAQDGVTAIAGFAGLSNLDRGDTSASRTNELGEFNFKHLPPARYTLSGRADGMVVTRNIALSEGQQLDVVLVLGAGRTIRGIVRGVPPAELSATKVSFQGERGVDASAAFNDVNVDAQGAFELRGVQAGRGSIGARTPRRMTSKPIDVPADADVYVELAFPMGFRLSGRITRGGQPLSGADVFVSAQDDRAQHIVGVETAADGRYVFEGIPRGEYSIYAARYGSRKVMIAADTEFDLDIPTSELTGTIFDEAGKVPIVGARVDLWSTPSSVKPARRFERSDHFGRFSLASLDAGSYLLTIARPGFALHREQIEFPTQSALAIRLNRDDGVVVRARELATGNALSRLIASERLGSGDTAFDMGAVMRIALDEQGEGRIPSGLAGSALMFEANGCDRITIPSWSGQPLQLAFRCSIDSPPMFE